MGKSDRTGPSSELLRIFCAVAEAGNVTQGADVLGRTQSAISVQLQNLEGYFAVRLFDRGSRGVTLTDHGKKLLPAAKKALLEIDRIGALFSEPLVGKIRVGIPDDYSETILERALARFTVQHANVEVFTRSGCSLGYPDAIKRNELDLAVYAAGPVSPEQIFFTEPMVWVAGADFVLDGNAPIPLTLFDRHCWWRDVATNALDDMGKEWRTAYLSENFVSIRAAIVAGIGVGVLAKSTIDSSMRVLAEAEGFPALPPASLSLLKNNRSQSNIVQKMEDAIRAAVLA